MKEKIQLVKGALEIVYVAGVITYVAYMARPDLRTQHTEYIQRKRNELKNWLEIQQTLESIRNLPETRNGSSA